MITLNYSKTYISNGSVSFRNKNDNKWYYFNSKSNLEKFMTDKGFDYFEWELISTQKLENRKKLWNIKVYLTDDTAKYTFLLTVIEKTRCIDIDNYDFKVEYFEVIKFEIINKEYFPNNLDSLFNN